MGNAYGRETDNPVRPVDLRRDRRVRYTPEQKQNVLELVDTGHTYREAARSVAVNMSSATVARWVNQRRDRLRRAEALRQYQQRIQAQEANNRRFQFI